MRNLLDLISKHNHFLLFILLEIFTLFLIIQNSNFHKTAFLNSTNGITANSFALASNIREYFLLKKTNDLLLLENAKLKSLISYQRSDYISSIDSTVLYRFDVSLIIPTPPFLETTPIPYFIPSILPLSMVK